MDFPIIIDVWTVEPSRREELVQCLGESIRQLVVSHPGFVSAEIYEGANRGKVAVKLSMGSSDARRDLTDKPEVEHVFRRAKEIATDHSSFYRLVESFTAGEPEPDAQAPETG